MPAHQQTRLSSTTDELLKTGRLSYVYENLHAYVRERPTFGLMMDMSSFPNVEWYK